MNSQLDKDFGSLPQRALGITEPDKHGHKEMQWDITIPQHDLNSTSWTLTSSGIWFGATTNVSVWQTCTENDHCMNDQNTAAWWVSFKLRSLPQFEVSPNLRSPLCCLEFYAVDPAPTSLFGQSLWKSLFLTQGRLKYFEFNLFFGWNNFTETKLLCRGVLAWPSFSKNSHRSLLMDNINKYRL